MALFPPIERDTSLADVRERLRARHAEVSAAGQAALSDQQALSPGYRGADGGWGTALKRVPAAPMGQPMVEVVNQCATVERLLDALEWTAGSAAEEPTTVLLAHPGSTSSKGSRLTTQHGGQLVPDHDLVLQVGSQIWVFEVSDVASSKDNNSKTVRDIRNLGDSLDTIDALRAFLVVSPERAPAITKKAVYDNRFQVQPVWTELDRTAIFEIRPV